jgi:hypothetical protein
MSRYSYLSVEEVFNEVLKITLAGLRFIGLLFMATLRVIVSFVIREQV